MTPQRFEALAQAYGGDLRRWPAAEQAAAEAWRRRSADAERLLAEARSLDQALACDRLSAIAPEARSAMVGLLRGSRRSGDRFIRGLSGLGALSALGAGMAAGAAAMALAFVSPPQGPDAEGLSRLYEPSSFGELPATAAHIALPAPARPEGA